MTLDIHKQCAVCAWRGTCAKKHHPEETSLHCPDFTRDAAFGDEEDGGGQERHKQIEDVFGDRKKK
ncbi:MAG: hypothetical protein HZB55_18485 [Deltaproteobacteria bacterium]|nr:hypothetical protein [Deltaproteobacteria bacterium]